MSFFCRRRRRGIKRRRVEISFVWFVCLLDLSYVMSVGVVVCGVCRYSVKNRDHSMNKKTNERILLTVCTDGGMSAAIPDV